MSEKLYFLISLILLLSFVGSVSAAEVTWDNNLGTGDRLWDTALNWNGGVPLADDTAIIDNYGDSSNGPIIQDGINAVADYLEMGYYSSPPNEAILTMTGGTLTVGGWIDPGGYVSGVYRFDVSGGNINVTGYGDGSWEGLYLGYAADTDAVMNITGGDIDIFGQVWMGWADTSRAIINMSDGTLNASVQIEIGSDSAMEAVFNMTGGVVTAGEWFSVGVWHDLGGNGTLNLHGGAIDAGNFRMGPVSQMDIGGGVLTSDTDLTVSNGFLFDPVKDTPSATGGVYTGTVPTLVERGRITAYGVNQGQIITDDVNFPAEAGLRALVKVDYDGTNPGKTTVSAAAVDPNLAYNPAPFDMARGVQPSEFSSISWSAGTNAAQHDVYFGTDETALDYKGRQAGTTYTPDIPYAFAADYFWRIDEVNAAGGVQWPGDVWEFTAADHVVVEDFDSYANNDELWAVWPDYFYADTKAEIYLNTDPNFLIDGNSVKFIYDNDATGGDKRKYSEIEVLASNLGAGSDWTISGLKALVLNFYGLAGNSAQPLYFAVEDSSANVGVATYDDANGTQEEFWHEWNINLEDFNGAGVDLANVNKIYLGVGVRGEMIPPAGIGGGEGDVYFDSFELWPARCRPEIVLGDFTGDCGTDGLDLALISEEWLMSDGWVVSAPPTYDPDIWLKFDEGTGQVATNSGLMGTDYNGQLGFTSEADANDPTWITTDPSPDRLRCLDFDGINDSVQVPDVNLNSNTVTITAWIKRAGMQTPWSGIVFSRDGTQAEGLHFGELNELRYTWNNNDTWWFESGLIVPDGLWTFAALVVEPTKATLYMSDGTTYSSATNAVDHIVQPFDGVTLIGLDDNGPADQRLFAGRIDDVRIYNKSLGLGEILGLAGISATLYDPLDATSNIIPRVPDPAVDPNFYPANPDIIDFRDYAAFADGWFETVLWP
jgi:hypothetical protein